MLMNKMQELVELNAGHRCLRKSEVRLGSMFLTS